MNIKAAIAAFFAGFHNQPHDQQAQEIENLDALGEEMEDPTRHPATPPATPAPEVDDPGQAWQGQQTCQPISDQTPGEGGILHSPLDLDSHPTMTRESMGHSMTPDQGPGMNCGGGGMEMDL